MKLKGLLLIILSLFLVTGCGEKTLDCSMSTDLEGIKIDIRMEPTFKGDKVTKLKMTYTYSLVDDTYADKWDEVSESFDDQFDAYGDEKGVTLSTSDKDYTYTVIIDIDISKASDNILETFDLEEVVDNSYSYDKTKEKFEEAGLTCK